MSLSSKYSIKLYKILKDEHKKNNRYNKHTKVEMKITYLREIIEVPNSYRFNDIKRQILEKAKKELKKHTDIEFEYHEIKNGRKVISVVFDVKDNNTIERKIMFNSIKEFASLIRDEYVGTNNFFGWKTINNKNYWLGIDNNGLVYGVSNSGEIKEFNAMESYDIYEIWFKIANNCPVFNDLVLNGVCIRKEAKNSTESWKKLNKCVFNLKDKKIV